MVTAIVMVQCKTGTVHSVAESLVDLDGVAEVYSISGEWDILAIIRVKEYDELALAVTEQIATITEIVRTDTHMAFRCYSKHNMERIWGEMISA